MAVISSVTLSAVEKRNLQSLKRGKNIKNEDSMSLYHLGLAEPIYSHEQDGSVSILGWKISANGIRWLEYNRAQRIDKTWNRVLAIVAILISLVALFLELDDRGFMGGLFDGFRTSQTVAQDSAQAPSDQSQSQ